MSDPKDDEREAHFTKMANESEAYQQRMAAARDTVDPAKPAMATWAKVTLIIVLGIPLGLIALVGLVLGVCFLGTR
jgi:uncharacterized protein involved in exopolysaccharide biosynthesis